MPPLSGCTCTVVLFLVHLYNTNNFCVHKCIPGVTCNTYLLVEEMLQFAYEGITIQFLNVACTLIVEHPHFLNKDQVKYLIPICLVLTQFGEVATHQSGIKT